jgi:hypothetical protein
MPMRDRRRVEKIRYLLGNLASWFAFGGCTDILGVAGSQSRWIASGNASRTAVGIRATGFKAKESG